MNRVMTGILAALVILMGIVNYHQTQILNERINGNKEDIYDVRNLIDKVGELEEEIQFLHLENTYLTLKVDNLEEGKTK